MAAALPRPLFIASIGNPPPTYHHTLHSAGHILLSALGVHLGYPTFRKTRYLANALVSPPITGPGEIDIANPRPILWQSPSLMNVSGVALAKAFRVWKTDMERSYMRFNTTGTTTSSSSGCNPILIVLHDELESAPGTLKIRLGGAPSARGHNGLKSIISTFYPSAASKDVSQILGKDGTLVRVGIGIGRPSSREKSAVSDFVLRRADQRQMENIEGCVGELMAILERAKMGGF